MFCLPKNSAIRRYTFRFLAAMSVYVLLTVSAGLCFWKFHPKAPLACLIALLPTVGIVGTVAAVAVFLSEEKDEFQRNLFIQSMLWGLGGLLTVMSAWGLLEAFTHIRHFNPMYTFSLFWLLVALAWPVVVRRYR